MQDSLPGVGTLCRNNAWSSPALGDVVDPLSFTLQAPLDDREIPLFNTSGSELIRKPGRCFRGSRQDQYSRDRPVESVNQSKKNVPWFIEMPLQVGFAPGQHIFVSTRIGL
jgi:hypothetical protein